jgi:hypothetical protein
MVQREVERAEAAHREAADRDAAAVRMEARESGREFLLEERAAPGAVGAVVVVAVVAAVEKRKIRRARSERAQEAEEARREEVRRVAAAPVEQDEDGAAMAASARRYYDEVQVPPEEAAMDGEACDARAERVGGPPHEVRRHTEQRGDDREDEELPHGRSLGAAPQPAAKAGQLALQLGEIAELAERVAHVEQEP